MLQLRDIMTTDIVTVAPETTLRDAMELLAARHVSGAPVLSGATLVGIVTASDLLGFAATLPGVPVSRADDGEGELWGESSVETDVEQEDEPASAFFSELWPDTGAEASERIASVDGPEWNMLEEHDVSEVMTRGPLVTLPPDADVEAAAELMREKRIHRVLVTENGHLSGIVSALDIAEAVAEHRFTKRTYVFNRDGNFSPRRGPE